MEQNEQDCAEIAQHFNRLTPAEAERLAILAEELGEAQQIVGKILRHGFDSWNPDDGLRTTNRVLLEKELGDVSFATTMLATQGDISQNAVDLAHIAKAAKIRKYLHHNL